MAWRDVDKLPDDILRALWGLSSDLESRGRYNPRSLSMIEAYGMYTGIKNTKGMYIHPSGTYTFTYATNVMFLQKAFGGLGIVDHWRYEDRFGNKVFVFSDSTTEVIRGRDNKLGKYGVSSLAYYLGRPNKGDSFIAGSRKSLDTLVSKFAELSLPVDDGHEPLTTRTHPELYERQEWALQQLQSKSGFHMLAGEVGVGKTHIAASYINDIIDKKLDAKVLIIEPVAEVVERFQDLIKYPSSINKSDIDNSDYNVIICDTNNLKSILHSCAWDLIVFDEFHNMDKNKTVLSFPYTAKQLPENILAMTGTVSSNRPTQVWSVSRNYISAYTLAYEVSKFSNVVDLMTMGPITVRSSFDDSDNEIYFPSMMSVSKSPKYFVKYVLGDYLVNLLRNDIKELTLEEPVTINKYASGVELSSEDMHFYWFLLSRAEDLGMTIENKLEILDDILNNNVSRVVVQPVRAGSTKYMVVDPNKKSKHHDLFFLGTRDGNFIDHRIDFISNLAKDKNEKILVYLNSNDYAERVVEDLNKTGVTTQFVDTSQKGAVKTINDSDADVVVFDITNILEGIDLYANNVVWYSPPRSAGLDEQACGRIMRLNSEQVDKNFYYLYHKCTIQRDITRNIINVTEINNLALDRDDKEIGSLSL